MARWVCLVGLLAACGGSPLAAPPTAAAARPQAPTKAPDATPSALPDAAQTTALADVRYECGPALKQDIEVRRAHSKRRLDALDRGNTALNLSCQELERRRRAELAERVDAFLEGASADYVERRCKDYKPPLPRLVLLDGGGSNLLPPARPQSDTNQQVSGIDEPDLIEVDQHRFYAVSGDKVIVFDSTNPQKPQKVGFVQVEGAARGLFAQGSRLVVLSSLGAPNPKRNCGMQCWQRGDKTPARLQVFDVSDPAKPALLRRLELSGYWLGARKIGGTVHALVADELGARRPKLDYAPEQVPRTAQAAWLAFEQLRRENAKVIAAFDVSTLLPQASETQGSVTRRLSECKASLSGAPDDEYTSILSFDLAEQKSAERNVVRTEPGTFYANSSRLYLTDPRAEYTGIHQLALEGASSRYLAGGAVPGRVPSQFALDEYENFLRVAVTDGQSNALHVLHAEGEELHRVGATDFGRGESLRAVRFAGKKGYAVTFPSQGRRVDPLFTLDLSDPERPRVLGELQVPGFSTYVQPLDAGHLLTVGYDAEPRDGKVRGMVVQVFDVTEPASPRSVDRREIGSAGTSSSALLNHLAFTYYPPKNLLLLPLTVCERRATKTEPTFSGLLLLGLGPSGHLSQRGRVSHGELVERDCNLLSSQGESAIERTALLDNFVYAVGDRMLTVVDLHAPYRARATMPLP